ncbi:hypothetical protein Tco_1001943 [Tanacetum coccineum]|uniref:Uncharacterized protein n=1 Tax=Tanacetum coccineum TaxID=301880 RepID=A0ABQ5F693_9ASTR
MKYKEHVKPSWHGCDSLSSWHECDSLLSWYGCDSLPSRHKCDSLPSWHGCDNLPSWHRCDSLPSWHECDRPVMTPLPENIVLSYKESDTDKYLLNVTNYQKLVEKVSSCLINIEKVESRSQVADILTKALGTSQHSFW